MKGIFTPPGPAWGLSPRELVRRQLGLRPGRLLQPWLQLPRRPVQQGFQLPRRGSRERPQLGLLPLLGLRLQLELRLPQLVVEWRPSPRRLAREWRGRLRLRPPPQLGHRRRAQDPRRRRELRPRRLGLLRLELGLPRRLVHLQPGRLLQRLLVPLPQLGQPRRLALLGLLQSKKMGQYS